MRTPRDDDDDDDDDVIPGHHLVSVLHHLVSVNSFMFHHAIMEQYRTGVNNIEVLIGIPCMLDSVIGVIAFIPLTHS